MRQEELSKNLEDNQGFWGGNVITKKQITVEGTSGAFARKKDIQAAWENIYYKGGICRYKDWLVIKSDFILILN